MIIIQSSKMIGNILTLDESISGNYQLKLFILNNVLYNVNSFNKPKKPTLWYSISHIA